jgi:hypothetical protein
MAPIRVNEREGGGRERKKERESERERESVSPIAVPLSKQRVQQISLDLSLGDFQNHPIFVDSRKS